MTENGKLLLLPPCAIPKPGENITWFEGNRRMQGVLLGYDIDERPIIINKFGLPTQATSFALIRLSDPFDRIEPNWMRLPPQGKIFLPSEDVTEVFKKKLAERIPPGPSYIELISEIFYRGFEVFLVGGTVRDIIQGDKSNDIDIVTTMPLKLSLPLLKSMFNQEIHHNKKTGFIRIGGSPSSGDPFVDVKNFPIYNPGGKTAIFGSDFSADLKLRDFSCNAVYYDPINNSLIDPSGTGIEDAQKKKLTIIKDADAQSPLYHSATIVIRLVKFVSRGYSCPQHTVEEIRSKFCPLLPTMSVAERIRYLNAQILNKAQIGNRVQAYENFAEAMSKLGLKEEYNTYFKPIEELLNLK